MKGAKFGSLFTFIKFLQKLQIGFLSIKKYISYNINCFKKFNAHLCYN